MKLITLKKDIHQALRSWNKVGCPAGGRLENLLLVQIERENNHSQGELESVHSAINRVLLHGLEELAAKDPQLEQILRQRFQEQQTSRQVGEQLNFSEDAINHRQAAAISQLAEIIFLREEETRRLVIQNLEGRLPPQTYAQLFGVDQIVRELEELLLRAGEPWQVTITGIGGIGKSAVADQVVRRALAHFHFRQIAFVRIQPYTLSERSESSEQTFEQLTLSLIDALGIEEPGPDRGSAIRRHLKARPHLVIIDNIEESSAASYIITQLTKWSEPSKFLLTSRSRPVTARATKVIHIAELPPDQALALVRHEARIRGLNEINAAEDEQLAPLTETLGGNPLALKLAVALLEVLPMQAIISDLRHGRTISTQELYKHIYWQAWRSLSREAQALLEAMPLISESGGTQEQLQAITGQPDDLFWQAVLELTTRCLLEQRGSIWERRYGIHRLTETFLNTEITGWDEQPGRIQSPN